MPWYADMVNYLACGNMPLEFSYQQKRKLRTDSRVYIWDAHYYSKEGHIRSSEDVYQKLNKVKFWINVMRYHMEDTLQEIEQPRKFSSQVFTSLLYLETVLNGLNIMIDAREWAT